jgi:putative transposase
MTWKTETISQARRAFAGEYRQDVKTMTELCREFGISRKTGYKWARRVQLEQTEDYADRPHDAHTHRNQVSAEVEGWVLKGKSKHPNWGPKKLVVWAKAQSGLERLCAVSTAGEILRRHGLVVSRKRTRKSEVYPNALTQATGCNEVWCVDFKGWFRLGDGSRCDPLTITDGHSRYILRCQAMNGPKMEDVQRVFEALFRQYGLPQVIRSDNGPPFASVGLGGLTALSLWWIKLGIRAERIRPGKPYENGSHERMHLTLKMEAASPPGYDLRGQQRRLEKFRREFNSDRPHEALEQKTPGSIYVPSERKYPVRMGMPDYGDATLRRKVQKRGEFKWEGRKVFLSEAFAGEEVALIRTGDGKYLVKFHWIEVGVFDEKTMKIEPMNPQNRRRSKRRRSP